MAQDIQKYTDAGWITFRMSRDVRTAPQPLKRFSRFVKPEPNFGPNMSITYRYTATGNLLNDGEVIGEYGDVVTTDFPIFSGFLTAQEWTIGLDTTWQSQKVVELNALHAQVVTLMQAASRKVDKIAGAAFLSADVVYTPTGTNSSKTGQFTVGSSTPTAVSTRPLTTFDTKNIVDYLRGAGVNCPGFGGGNNYIGIISTSVHRSLIDDNQLVDVKRYADAQAILDGEIGGYYKARFLEETNVLNPNLPGGCGQAVFFGDDPCIEIEIEPVQIQSSYDPRYGRFKGLRWFWFGGISKTYYFSWGGQVRIVKVDSLPQPV